MIKLYTIFLLMVLLFIPASAEDVIISLPDGFQATVFAEDLGRARHIAVNSNGDVYVRLRDLKDGNGIVALRDDNNDGTADVVQYFENTRGTGIEVHNNYLYFSSDTSVHRYPLTGNTLVPTGGRETIIGGIPEQRQHAAKPLAFDDQGNLYLNIGAPSNACQEDMRTPGSPGQDPCPQLEYHGGIWVFSDNTLNQSLYTDAFRFTTGIRHCVAVAWNPVVDHLYAVQHGRDQLDSLWPESFNAEQNAELPAEEFLLIEEGDDFGWPFCYYDGLKDQKVLAPEYGGDGTIVGRCAEAKDPIMDFPAHWAPNDLIFYTDDQFPEAYQNGAFVAFHGSWNRAPLPQQGYNVAFVPFDGELPSGDFEVFAKGFADEEEFFSTRDAKYRPMGLAQGPDGALYITDSRTGRIWKITYTGN